MSQNGQAHFKNLAAFPAYSTYTYTVLYAMKLRPFNVTSKIPWIHFKGLSANAERIFKVCL